VRSQAQAVDILMKTSSAAGFIFLVMPNSLAALSELLKSSPAFASASTAHPPCACSRKEEKSEAPSGYGAPPDGPCAPFLYDLERRSATGAKA